MTLERPMFPPQRTPHEALFRRVDISPENFFEALGRVRRAARDEIERLIEWLDSTIDVDEDSAADDDPCDGDPDCEPSLGSFDRMSDQVKAWSSHGWGDVDVELDRCDDEDGDPAEEGGDHEAESDTGICDLEGLAEQTGICLGLFRSVE